MKKQIFLFLGFLILIPSVLAIQPTIQTARFATNPYYIDSLDTAKRDGVRVDISVPDGITSVKSVIVNFRVLASPSTIYTLLVDTKPCKNRDFKITTSPDILVGDINTIISFDCTNIMDKEGGYVISLDSNARSIEGSLTGWVDFVYVNKPDVFADNILNQTFQKVTAFSQKAFMSIGGTEYQLGQNGTLFIKLLDNNNLPINNGFCSITTYYPNKTIKFMDNSPTTFLENGLYYKDFFVPTIEGLYIADASCIYADTVFRYNTPSEDCGFDGNIGSGTSPQPLTFSEVDCTQFHTLGGGTYQNWTFNYTSIGTINLSAISQIDVNWVGQLSASGGFLEIYDFNASVWDSLGSSISTSGTSLVCGNNIYITRTRVQNFTSYVSNNTIKVRIFRSGTATLITDSIEIIFHNNGSVVASLRGSSEIHVSNIFNSTTNLTVNLNQTQLGSILSSIASVNQTLNTTIINYLVQINGTVFNINNSQYNSLLSAINSDNATGNQSLSILFALNGSVFNLSQAESSHFNQVLALLNEINYSLNTTLEFKLDLINNTVIQINQSQLAYYLSLLNAINSVNLTANTTLVNYLVYINGTTTQINDSLFSDYMNLLNAINSMNGSINNSVIPLLINLNATSNTTLTFVASINQSLLNYYLSLKDFLSSINVTINTTMENKLDLINQTVFQINDSLTALNITANFTGLFDALASINGTINSTVLNELLLINSNILNHNSSEYQHFLDMSVLLNDINFGINTTMENKLDFINSTTWQTLLMLNNLTIGNVSVSADVNWTEGYVQTSLLSFSDNIGGEGITLTSETLMCISNTTLQHLINATQCVQGICHTGNSTITETCLRGCANNQCIPTQQVAFGTAIIVALLIISGIYVAYKAWK